MRLFCTTILLMLALTGLAQPPGQIVRGRIIDDLSQQPLEGANVLVRQGQGVATDADGRFTLRLVPGRYTLRISILGYRNQIVPVTVGTTEVVLDLKATAENQTLTEVVVSGASNRAKVASTQVGLEKVDQKAARLLPALFGEVDIIKVFQLKPGVKSAGEGTSGISVRGGDTDQTLFLLDGAPVYNPSHLFGFFSTFNIDAVKEAELYKAGFPAEYSGRLSSVINVNTLPARDTAFHFGAGIGLLASRINVSGPIIKNKLAFRVAARRTYADLFTTLINRSQAGDTAASPIPTYYFYDVNARLDYQVSDKTDLSATLYKGRDNFQIDPGGFSTRFAWGNTAATLRLNHRFSD